MISVCGPTNIQERPDKGETLKAIDTNLRYYRPSMDTFFQDHLVRGRIFFRKFASGKLVTGISSGSSSDQRSTYTTPAESPRGGKVEGTSCSIE